MFWADGGLAQTKFGWFFHESSLVYCGSKLHFELRGFCWGGAELKVSTFSHGLRLWKWEKQAQVNFFEASARFGDRKWAGGGHFNSINRTLVTMSAVDWIMFWLVSFLSVQKSKLFFVKKLKKIIENSALMPQKSEFNYFYSLFPQWIGLMGTPHDPDVWNVSSVGDDLARKIGLGLRAVVGDIWVIMLIRKIKNNTLGVWNYKGKDSREEIWKQQCFS